MRIVITGGSGQVGQALIAEADRRGLSLAAPDETLLDLRNPDFGRRVLAYLRPDIVIHAAAFTQVDEAERQRGLAFEVNANGSRWVAEAARDLGAPVLYLSTDYVFDGRAHRPYRETDVVGPLSVYGKSKLAGERAIHGATCRHLTLRVASVFAPGGSNFVRTMARLLGERDEVSVVADQISCPTPAAAIARTLLDLAPRVVSPGFRDWGTYHYAGTPAVSWYDFARAIRERLDAPRATLTPTTAAAFGLPAPRPAYAALDTTKITRVFGIKPPEWADELGPVFAS